jgi:protein-L-isoaspartate O-methyltransferase
MTALLFSSLAILLAQDSAAPYYPTPQLVVERMLRLGQLRSTESAMDLGSGDGRIVIMASRKFGAQATGIELDHDLVVQSRDRLKKLNLADKARIIEGDLFAQDYSQADLLTIYLLPETNAKLAPLLEKQLKKGARVVCHDFEIPGWKPDKTEVLEDQEGRGHTLFLYRR